MDFSFKNFLKVNSTNLLKKIPIAFATIALAFSVSYLINSFIEIKLINLKSSFEVKTKPVKAVVKKKKTTKKKNFALEISKIDPFDVIPDEKTEEKLEEVVISPLNINLLGTIVGETPEDSFAILKDSRGKSGIYVIGDSCEEGVTITAIEEDKIILKRGNKLETVFLYEQGENKEQTTAGTKLPGRGVNRRKRNPAPYRGRRRSKINNITVVQEGEDQYVIDGDDLNKITEDMGTILTQARIVPYLKDGETQGYKIFAVRPGSIFEKIGLKNGDVIKMVNGMEIKSPQEALDLFRQLRDETEFEIVVERRGQTKTLRYTIR